MPVKHKGREQLIAASRPLLEPGERIQLMVVARLGKAPVKKNIAVAALMVVLYAVVAALGGGSVVGAYYTKGNAYFVVTDLRLLIFAGRKNRSGPGRLIGNVPRAAVTVTKVVDGFTHRVRLGFAGSSEVIRLQFAALNKGSRRNGRELVALLTQQPGRQPGPVRAPSQSPDVLDSDPWRVPQL